MLFKQFNNLDTLKEAHMSHPEPTPLKIQSQICAAGKETNHAETLKISSKVQGGRIAWNRNETLHIRTSVQAGHIAWNHNQSLDRR
jgi:hypothetical protein